MRDHDKETFADCRASASLFALRPVTPKIRGNSFSVKSDTSVPKGR
jgi:hypothetical protein